MADSDPRSERIKYLTEVFRFTWLSLLALGSGTFGLLLSANQTPLRALLIGIGMIASIGMIVALLSIDRQIRAILRRLEEEREHE